MSAADDVAGAASTATAAATGTFAMRLAREPAQGGAVHAEQRPLLHLARADAGVKSAGVFVPLQRRPLEATRLLVQGETADGVEKIATDAAVAEALANKEVFEIKTRPRDEG